MDLEHIDWTALERLRNAFLEGSAGSSDYWRTDADLTSYDQTFAQRIGWKWEHVFGLLKTRGWTPPVGELFDWGCGSGIAHRVFLDWFGPGSVTRVRLWDRSARALAFARRRATEKFPGLNVECAVSPAVSGGTLLLSHVLSELDEQQLRNLVSVIASADAVLWVEPGTHEVSRRLSALRAELVQTFRVVAPCLHQAACGILAAGNEQHWCHQFAVPPPAVFTDVGWTRFARLLGIDLRSLPVSFLVLDKRPVTAAPRDAVTVLGRPRVFKGHALFFACDSTGVRDYRLTKRVLPEPFRRAKKGEVEPVQAWRTEGEEIVEVRCFQ